MDANLGLFFTYIIINYFIIIIYKFNYFIIKYIKNLNWYIILIQFKFLKLLIKLNNYYTTIKNTIQIILIPNLIKVNLLKSSNIPNFN
jgi:hypothetical protein